MCVICGVLLSKAAASGAPDGPPDCSLSFFCLSESLKDLVAMEVDSQAEVKSELPTPPASDVGSPSSFSHCGSDSEPDSPMAEDTKVCSQHFQSLALVKSL